MIQPILYDNNNPILAVSVFIYEGIVQAFHVMGFSRVRTAVAARKLLFGFLTCYRQGSAALFGRITEIMRKQGAFIDLK